MGRCLANDGHVEMCEGGVWTPVDSAQWSDSEAAYHDPILLLTLSSTQACVMEVLQRTTALMLLCMCIAMAL